MRRSIMLGRILTSAGAERWPGSAIALICLLVALNLLYSPAAAQDGQNAEVIQVTKTATPNSLWEPGGDVTFSILVENTSEAPVTMTSLVDSAIGDLAVYHQSTCSVPQELAASGQEGSTYSCTFSAFVSGDPGAHANTVTVSGVDNQGAVVTAFDIAEVEIKDFIWYIEASKTVSPTVLVEPGGTVTFTVRLSNPSVPGGPAQVTELVDSLYGDIYDPDNPSIFNSTCKPVTIEPQGTYSCTFQAEMFASAGDRVTSIMTSTSLMEDPASASVIFVAQPPPTGAGVVPSFVAGLFAAGGTVLVAAGTWVRRRTR
jgi:hypothetical protein